MEYDITDGKCIIYKGTGIEEDFFQNNEEFSEVVFPDTLKTIGKGAFCGCTKLKAVTIPLPVTEIGIGAFSECDNLESIEVEEGNSKYRSFDNCCLTRNMKTLVFGCKTSRIPPFVETIGESAFRGTILAGLTIPKSVRVIEDFAFAYNSMKSIRLPKGLERIGSEAFYNCYELTSINIPGSIQSIGEKAFGGCQKLKNIRLRNGIQRISEFAFSCCCVESIKIPSSVTVIEDFAFSDCHYLSSIEIPDSVVEFGDQIWNGCNRIRDIHLPSGGPLQYDSFRKSFKKSHSAFFESFGINQYRDYILHVPAGTENDYRKDPFFGQFGEIVTI